MISLLSISLSLSVTLVSVSVPLTPALFSPSPPSPHSFPHSLHSCRQRYLTNTDMSEGYSAEPASAPLAPAPLLCSRFAWLPWPAHSSPCLRGFFTTTLIRLGLALGATCPFAPSSPRPTAAALLSSASNVFVSNCTERGRVAVLAEEGSARAAVVLGDTPLALLCAASGTPDYGVGGGGESENSK